MKSGANKENYLPSRITPVRGISCGDEGAESKVPHTFVLPNPGPPKRWLFHQSVCLGQGGSSPALVTSCTFFLGFFLRLDQLAMSIPYLLSSAGRFPRPLSTLDDARQLALGPRLAPKSCWLLLMASRVCSCGASVITPGGQTEASRSLASEWSSGMRGGGRFSQQTV